MTRSTAAIAPVLFALVACVGDGPVSGTDAGNDGAGDGGGTGSDAGSPPAHAAGGVALAPDTNKACSVIKADATISRALDESDVTDYVLYWGSNATTKIGQPITVAAKTGTDITYAFNDAARPPNATHLLAFTKNASGEMATGVSTSVSELGQTVIKDISTGVTGGAFPHAIIDETNAKIMVVAQMADGNPGLFRCTLDGVTCTFADISVTKPDSTGTAPMFAVDIPNGKLYATGTNNVSNANTAALFLCGLDGSGCVFKDVSAQASQGQYSGSNTIPVVDKLNNKLIIAANHPAGPAAYICDLDGTNCAYHDIKAGRPAGYSAPIAALIDTTANKLLVPAVDNNNNYKPALFRCDLGGTNCTWTDTSAGQGNNSALNMSATIDTVNKKLLSVQMNGTPSLFRCDLDGANCTWKDISAGQLASNVSAAPGLGIDTVNQKLFVAATTTSNVRVGVFRCDLDGMNCAYFDASPGAGAQLYVNGAWNPGMQTFHVVWQDSGNAKLNMSIVCGR